MHDSCYVHGESYTENGRMLMSDSHYDTDPTRNLTLKHPTAVIFYSIFYFQMDVQYY